MDEYIEKMFYELQHGEYKNSSNPSFFSEYNDTFRQKIHNIAHESDVEKIRELYNNAVSLGQLSRFPEIAFAFSYNPNLPTEIVNNIVHESVPDTKFIEELFNKHKDKMSASTIMKVYDIKPGRVVSQLNSLKYKNFPISKEELTLPEAVISHISLKEFDKVKAPTSSYSYYCDSADIYRYVSNETFVDAILDKVRSTSENKEIIITELINNHFLSDKKKDEIFDEFGCNFSFVRHPTPHITEAMYESTVDTVFKSDMSRYSKKTSVEQRIYFDANTILGDMARYGLLTSGMQLDLMNMLLERKDRSSENLTRSLISGTNDPRVLHLALQLKSTNDRDDAIKSKYLGKEDIVEVARQSKKKIDTELRKGNRPSDKHVERLCDLCGRCTLPPEVYETMLTIKSSQVGLNLARSEFTPFYILTQVIDQIHEKDRYINSLQECLAKLNMFVRENSMPFQMFYDIAEILPMCSKSRDKLTFDYIPKRNRFSNFLKQTEHVEMFIKELEKLSTELHDEYAKGLIVQALKEFEEFKEYKPQERNPKDITEMTSTALKERKKRIGSILSSQTHHLFKGEFYITLSEKSKEFFDIVKELEKREERERDGDVR